MVEFAAAAVAGRCLDGVPIVAAVCGLVVVIVIHVLGPRVRRLIPMILPPFEPLTA